ncbi:hypothetical protein EGW08_006658 [Elysia chlorotica]|uniref:RHD domain-containing protein n=1 Tax=Elysia chlorotica TaxID=188477 RepID=A0A433TVK3_ELYCH|nr:hypothetical protein EGW08_006658 [Elysia chlorotica]
MSQLADEVPLNESSLPVELQSKNVINPIYNVSALPLSVLNGSDALSSRAGSFNSHGVSQGEPYVVITEQPQQRGFRFRYACEGGSHGGLQGTRSERSRKSYPTIKVENYTGALKVVVSLVTDEKTPRPHAHKLVGTNCKNGYCSVEIKANSEPISFPNICISHVTRRNLIDVLTERFLDRIKLNRRLSGTNLNPDQTISEDQSKNMQLNVVCLSFEVYLGSPDGSFGKMLPAVVSQPIFDSKSPGASALKICRMDKYGGCCSGNEEVFLLCEKVQKDDIQVRFVEQNEDGGVEWEAYGNFGPLDVHRQYAIVFKTPAYWNTNIDKAVNVLIMLQRKSDKEVSEPKAFTYFPQNRGEIIMLLTLHVSQTRRRVAERTIAALVDYAETGDIRHLLLVQRQLMTISNKNGDLPLHLSVINLQPEALKSLVDVMCTLQDSKLHINALNHMRQSALHLAAIMDQPKVVESLLHAGADPSIADRHGNTAAHLAVANCAHQCLASLVKYLRPGMSKSDPFPELNYLNFDGYSPVHLAAQSGNVNMLRTLIYAQADVNLPDGKSGKTALHHAVDSNDLPVAGFLLTEAHTDVNARCFDGNTALHIACARQLVAMVALLVTAGADQDCENEEIPDTGEEEAEAEGEVQVVAETRALDKLGLRPVDYANDNEKILKILRGESEPDCFLLETSPKEGSEEARLLARLSSMTVRDKPVPVSAPDTELPFTKY